MKLHYQSDTFWEPFWMTVPKQRHWTTPSLTSNYTPKAAFWSPIIRAGAAGCAWMTHFYWRRKRGEVTEFAAGLGRTTEWDVVAAGRAEVNEFTACWTRAPQPALTETCKQVWSWSRNRESRRSIRSDGLRRTVHCLTDHNPPPPPLLY